MWTEPILHVDMDSFYVAVERLDHPDLRGKPVAVGGAGARGVIASASYEARRFGVASAQPTVTARRLCPSLRVVPPRHDRYRAVSAEVFAVFRSFTPLVEGLSLDEAFLDISGLRRHRPSPVAVGEEIRRELRDRLSLTASVGVAGSKFVAKLASRAAKPDGLTHVPARDQLEFLHSLPAGDLWGIGPATLAALHRLGVETVGDISRLPLEAVIRAVGPTTGRQILDLARGIDPRPVVADSDAKSISVEETYPRDLEGRDLVEAALLAHAQSLAGRLRRSGVRARTIILKVRFDDFSTHTRSTTLDAGVDGAREIARIGSELLSRLGDLRPVRLLGLGGSALHPVGEPTQLDLDGDADWDRVEDAVVAVRERFGEDAVRPARLLPGRKNAPDHDEP